MRKSAATPHYPVITAIARGLKSKNIFEFGCGGSTVALVDAVRDIGCRVFTVDTRPLSKTNSECESLDYDGWTYFQMRSEEALKKVVGVTFDFVFHDGAHDFETVRSDLITILPQISVGGILTVHDTMLPEVQEAVSDALTCVNCASVTLPYACGLDIIRIEP